MEHGTHRYSVSSDNMSKLRQEARTDTQRKQEGTDQREESWGEHRTQKEDRSSGKHMRWPLGSDWTMVCPLTYFKQASWPGQTMAVR
jgi:hypothetical protein